MCQPRFSSIPPGSTIDLCRLVRAESPPSSVLILSNDKNYKMPYLFGIFVALEFLPDLRRRLYASKTKCQDTEMQTLDSLTCNTGESGSNGYDMRGEDGRVQERRKCSEKRLPRAADASEAGLAACKRIWREWWI